MIVSVDNKINIVNGNIKRYKGLDYNCNLGDVIEVKYEHTPTHKQVIYKCDECNSELTTTYYVYNRNKEDICQKCKVSKVGVIHIKDHVGEKIGMLTVLYRYYKLNGKVLQKWRVRCECGKELDVRTSTLRCKIPSCGCNRKSKTGNVKPLEDRRGKNTKNLRIRIFERDNYTCVNCGKRGVKLNAHHITAWCTDTKLRYNMDNMITLCYTCHREYHSVYGNNTNCNETTFNKFLES